jgi:glycosyltransferase involved in cell wall biosynthesis
MNILLLDQYSDPGGAQQALLELLPAIRQRGWRALVGLPGSGKLFDAVRALGLEVERIDCGPYRSGRKSAADFGRFVAQTPRLAAQIRSLANRVDAELIYVNGPRVVPAAALAGLRCPVLFHSHSWLPPGIARRATGLALRRMDARIVANCEFTASPWRRFVRAKRISIVANGVAGPQRVPQRQPAGPPRIGCIGRIGPEKGQREFVAAAAQIHSSLPECRFVVFGDALFGDGTAERYAAEVRSAAAALPVEFRGWAADVYAALSELDLLLVPSVGAEATTRVILEAFSAGVPVVALHTGGIPEVVENGVSGVLARSADEMARAAVALLTGDPDRRFSIARAGRAAWERRFTIEKFQQWLLQITEEWAYGEHAVASPSRC